MEAVVRIQAFWRMYTARRDYRKLMKYTRMVQHKFRTPKIVRTAVAEFHAAQQAIRTLQALVRAQQAVADRLAELS